MSSAADDGASEDIRLELLRRAESGDDYEAALGLALACVRSPDRWLRTNALHCFGYIARACTGDWTWNQLCPAPGNPGEHC